MHTVVSRRALALTLLAALGACSKPAEQVAAPVAADCKVLGALAYPRATSSKCEQVAKTEGDPSHYTGSFKSTVAVDSVMSYYGTEDAVADGWMPQSSENPNELAMKRGMATATVAIGEGEGGQGTSIQVKVYPTGKH